MMENTDHLETTSKQEKKRRNNPENNIEESSKRSKKEENINSDSDNDEKLERDSNTDHSYAGTKSERKKKKVDISPIKSDKKLKHNRKERKKDDNNADFITSVHINDGKKPFQCDGCGSPSITNPMLKGNRLKTSKHLPSPRRKVDPETKKILLLCNACGLAFGKKKKIRKKQLPPSLDEKQKYLDEGCLFAEELAKELANEEAKRLYCSYFTKTPCGCIQRYIGNDKSSNRLESARTLLQIMSKAKQYKSMKFKDDNLEQDLQDSNQNENESKGNKKQKRKSNKKCIGLGNGHKKSKEFENYVLEQRAWLKKKFGLCETGTKRVLLYSNNFLHKKLKTEPGKSCRVPRQKGLAALGKLMTIKDLPKERCCVDNCVSMALTLHNLLQQWRDRSVSGQAEARRVIAEMLTPSGGSRTNCYKFISWVTGCSLTTIGKVNEQMKKTGGNREPPEHGLKRWWKDHPKPKKEKIESKAVTRSSVAAFTQDTSSPIFPPLVQSFGIIQAAANSSGLTAVMQGQQQSQQQQQNHTMTSNQGNNATVITVTAGGYPQSFITLPGNTVAIPMNAVPMQNYQFQQQLQQPRIQFLQQQQPAQTQQQQQQQQQQNHQSVAIGGSQMTNINRQQQVTTPTMVSNASQQGPIVLTPVLTESVSESCIPSMAIQQSTVQASNTQNGIQIPTQFVIAPAQGNHLLLPNNAQSILGLANQSQENDSASSNVSSLPIVSCSSTTDFLSSEGSLTITASQLGHLIQQNSSSPMQVSFMSQS